MTPDTQIIKAPGGDLVVVDQPDYEALWNEVELMRVERDHARNMAGQPPCDEWFPHDFGKKVMLSNEAPLKLWREHRGLTQKALAEQAKVPQSAISNIEGGNTLGSVAALQSLSKVLGCHIEMLLPYTD